MPKPSSSRQKRFTELLVFSSLYTEAVLANELGRRGYVTGETTENKPLFRLALYKATSGDIDWHCKHYTARGVMKLTSLEQPWPRT